MIDDDAVQAAALAKKLSETIPDSELMHACTEESILNMVENKFFNLAVLDIRMDNFDFDGIQIAKRILEVNPFARIIFVSRCLPGYMEQLTPLLQNGNVLGFSDKKADYNAWGEELKGMICSVNSE